MDMDMDDNNTELFDLNEVQENAENHNATGIPGTDRTFEDPQFTRYVDFDSPDKWPKRHTDFTPKKSFIIRMWRGLAHTSEIKESLQRTFKEIHGFLEDLFNCRKKRGFQQWFYDWNTMITKDAAKVNEAIYNTDHSLKKIELPTLPSHLSKGIHLAKIILLDIYAIDGTFTRGSAQGRAVRSFLNTEIASLAHDKYIDSDVLTARLDALISSTEKRSSKASEIQNDIDLDDEDITDAPGEGTSPTSETTLDDRKLLSLITKALKQNHIKGLSILFEKLNEAPLNTNKRLNLMLKKNIKKYIERYHEVDEAILSLKKKNDEKNNL